MTETPHLPARPGLRVGDADRAATAARLHTAAAEGRLTLEEADERLAAAYAARVQPELDALVTDLPAPPLPPPPPLDRRPLRLHAALAALLSVVLVLVWAGSDADRPWFLWPVFWLALSVFVHARRRRSGRAGRQHLP